VAYASSVRRVELRRTLEAYAPFRSSFMPRLVIAVALLALVPGELDAEQPAVRRPNVLFLISDDQRPDTIAALGNDLIRTPHLDALVRRGTAFTRATCSFPLCVASRAELLTGCVGFRNGVHPPRNEPDLDLVTWPAAMKAAGYHTWWVGKWHIAGRPSTRGFEESRGLFSGGRAPTEPQFDSAGREVTGYKGWTFQTDDRQLFPEQGIGLTPDISAKFADAAIEFVERRTEKPWFLQVNFTAPHDPLLVPPGDEFEYEPARLPVPPNFAPRHPFDHGNFDGRDERLFPWPRTKAVIRRDLAVYYAILSHLDAQVGRILAALEESGGLENTLVIYSSDHGLALGSHGLTGKQNQYEHTINVPLVFAGPGVPHGERRAAQCYLRDLFPTVCEMTGVPIPPTVQGRSLVPVLAGDRDEVYPFVVGYFTDTQRMIRDDRWKLIRYPEADREQLFDLRDDPFELQNLSDDPSQRERVRDLGAKLDGWLREHGDPLAAAASSAR
jgi:arylsulfatase A-like enzyme